jgi:hypothetical protein
VTSSHPLDATLNLPPKHSPHGVRPRTLRPYKRHNGACHPTKQTPRTLCSPSASRARTCRYAQQTCPLPHGRWPKHARLPLARGAAQARGPTPHGGRRSRPWIRVRRGCARPADIMREPQPVPAVVAARWRLIGAEAMLRLRSRWASGAVAAYGPFHLQQAFQRHHAAGYANGTVPTPQPALAQSSRS